MANRRRYTNVIMPTGPLGEASWVLIHAVQVHDDVYERVGSGTAAEREDWRFRSDRFRCAERKTGANVELIAIADTDE